MPYRLETLRPAERDFRRLDRTVQLRLRAHIRQLAENPRPSGFRKLVGEDYYRVRVGDYRIVYVIDDGGRVVTVAAVRHRSQAYRGLPRT